MEKHYLVRWSIDQFESNPLEGIRKAIAALPTDSNPDSIATVFEVDEIVNGVVVKTLQIDTLEEGCNPLSDEDQKNFEVGNIPESVEVIQPKEKIDVVKEFQYLMAQCHALRQFKTELLIKNHLEYLKQEYKL